MMESPSVIRMQMGHDNPSDVSSLNAHVHLLGFLDNGDDIYFGSTLGADKQVDFVDLSVTDAIRFLTAS